MNANPRPHLLAGRPARAQAPIVVATSKIGGAPVGMPSANWPHCLECSAAMDFLLQINLRQPTRLSDRFAFAYLFMCHGYLDSRGCNTWDAEGSSNRVVLVEHPSKAQAAPYLGEVSWPEYALTFNRYLTFEQRREAQEKRRAKVSCNLKKAMESREVADDIVIDLEAPRAQTVCVGGDPVWLQSPEMVACPACSGSMRLLAQIDSEVEKRGNGSGVFLPFGSAGQGYAFICELECAPSGASLLWQTT